MRGNHRNETLLTPRGSHYDANPASWNSHLLSRFFYRLRWRWGRRQWRWSWSWRFLHLSPQISTYYDPSLPFGERTDLLTLSDPSHQLDKRLIDICLGFGRGLEKMPSHLSSQDLTLDGRHLPISGQVTFVGEENDGDVCLPWLVS